MGIVEQIASWRADRRIRRLLRSAPERPLADVDEHSFVRVIGTITPHRGHVLEAPLSGRPCVYYSIVVRAQMRLPSSLPVAGGRWQPVNRTTQWRHARTLFDEQKCVPFVLESDSGRAIVDPDSARISTGFDHSAELDDPRALDVFRRLGLAGSADAAQFQEAILAVGERIALYGAAAREPDTDDTAGERDYRAGSSRLRFAGRDRFPLVIRDDMDRQ